MATTPASVASDMMVPAGKAAPVESVKAAITPKRVALPTADANKVAAVVLAPVSMVLFMIPIGNPTDMVPSGTVTRTAVDVNDNPAKFVPVIVPRMKVRPILVAAPAIKVNVNPVGTDN